MPTGVYKRSEAEKERLRKMIKGIRFIPPKGVCLSPDTQFKPGNIPWDKGKKRPEMSGNNNPMKRQEIRKKVSLACKGRKSLSGQNHPNWKGGKTPLIMRIRNHQKTIEWRQAIFERDKYTCQICHDDRGRNLNAHHRVQVADIVHTLKIATIKEALNTPILWKLSNGITLCRKCHIIANAASKVVKQIYGGVYE